MNTVCVIGIWHLGIVNCVGFVEAGYKVVGIDFDPDKATSLQNSQPPLFEPGLEDLMKKHLSSGQLSFTHTTQNIPEANWVVIAYDTPVDDKGEIDLTPILNATNAIAPYLSPHTTIIITSQMPIGMCEKVEHSIHQQNPNWQSGVVYVPENLRLGSAIERFRHPDMIVIGANNEQAQQSALDLYFPFHTEKPLMNLRSAEMVKHALNTFLATSITFINEIANLSDRLEADAVSVGKALKLDKRIGSKALLSPGLGFSGGTLARDVVQLSKLAQETQYEAKLIDAIISINEGTFDQVIIKLQNRLGSLTDKRIGLLGLTYKSNTSTMRQSPAIKICNKLQAMGAKCMGYDPGADTKETQTYNHLFCRTETIQELAYELDALVLITEWPQFRELDFTSIGKIMKQRVIVDAKNYLNGEMLVSAGFDYQGFGRS